MADHILATTDVIMGDCRCVMLRPPTPAESGRG